MKIKIYVVSLKSAENRRINIINQLKRINFEYEIIDAVNGKELSQNKLAELVDTDIVKKYPNWLTLGAIGCSLSHHKIFSKIIEDDIDYGIILEDDAKVLPNFESVIRKLIDNKLLEKDTVTLLYTQNFRKKIVEVSLYDEKKIYNNYTLNYTINSESLETAIGYIISLNTAKKMKKFILPIRYAADSWSDFLKNNIISKVNCIFPYIIIPYGFPSEIGYGNNKFKYFLKRYFPYFYKHIIKFKTLRYIKNISRYKKLNKPHIFYIKNKVN